MRVQVDQLLILHAAEKLDALAVLLAQALELGAAADHLQALARVAGRLRGDLDALVRDELGDGQEVVVRLAGAKPVDLDRGMHDPGIAPGDLADPALGVARVGDVSLAREASRRLGGLRFKLSRLARATAAVVPRRDRADRGTRG